MVIRNMKTGAPLTAKDVTDAFKSVTIQQWKAALVRLGFWNYVKRKVAPDADAENTETPTLVEAEQEKPTS